jgi:hypothetical protein
LETSRVPSCDSLYKRRAIIVTFIKIRALYQASEC